MPWGAADPDMPSFESPSVVEGAGLGTPEERLAAHGLTPGSLLATYAAAPAAIYKTFVEHVFRANKALMSEEGQYRPGQEDSKGVALGQIAVGPMMAAGLARATWAPRFSGAVHGGVELGAMGGKEPPKITALVDAWRDHPEFEALSNQYYRQLTAERGVVKDSVNAFSEAVYPNRDFEKVMRLDDLHDFKDLGQVAERAAAWELYSKSLGGNEFELGAMGGRGRQAPSRPTLDVVAADLERDIAKFESGLQKEGRTPQQIADAINGRYGGGVTADDIARGDVWWRVGGSDDFTRFAGGRPHSSGQAEVLTSGDGFEKLVFDRYGGLSPEAAHAQGRDWSSPIDAPSAPAPITDLPRSTPGPRAGLEFDATARALIDQLSAAGKTPKEIASILEKETGQFVRVDMVDDIVNLSKEQQAATRAAAKTADKARRADERSAAAADPAWRSERMRIMMTERHRDPVFAAQRDAWLQSPETRAKQQEARAAKGILTRTPEVEAVLLDPANAGLGPTELAQQLNDRFKPATRVTRANVSNMTRDMVRQGKIAQPSPMLDTEVQQFVRAAAEGQESEAAIAGMLNDKFAHKLGPGEKFSGRMVSNALYVLRQKSRGGEAFAGGVPVSPAARDALSDDELIARTQSLAASAGQEADALDSMVAVPQKGDHENYRRPIVSHRARDMMRSPEILDRWFRGFMPPQEQAGY